jgi:hypothetical protein
MAELRALKQVLQAKWLICGDFNLIKKVNEKNNENVNLRMMGRFSALIEALELVDFPLLGRRFTWSKNQEIATLTRIDRVFVTKEWYMAFLQFQLMPASSNVSDHCPLQLKPMERNHLCGFRFESHWLKDEEFLGVMQNTWNKGVQSSDPTRVLHIKIERTTKALKSWNRGKVRWIVDASNIASEIIFNLDLAQEDRQLTHEERELRATLKAKLLGFTAIDRSRWRQRSRLTWMKEGSANTKLFHLRANGRRRKNHIPELVGERGKVSTHKEKEEILYKFFKGSLGEAHGRTVRLNWDILNMLRAELHNLDELFTEEELKAAVFGMPGEKAPGPNGFTSCFLKTCWTIIKDDLLAAFNCFHSLHANIWNLLNTANMVLLPKKECSETVSDFRPCQLDA